MEKFLENIADLLGHADSVDRNFPPTLLYEEGWMLRLVLQWFARTEDIDHELAFLPGSRWYSEALLASAFLPRKRGDKFGEGYTHADGAIGHFRIGELGQSELGLDGEAKQFIVTEAKMFSGLSKGTKRAPTYNQAARNVACMAELFRLANLDPSNMTKVAFVVLAPQEQIDAGVFSNFMERSSIERVVAERVNNYDEPKTDWFENWFMPTFRTMEIRCLSWEEIVDFIKSKSSSCGEDLELFYQRCLEFNRNVRFQS